MITTSKEFFHELSKRTGKTQKECKEFWGHVLDTITDSCRRSDESSTILPHLGKILAKVDPPAVKRDPRNNKVVAVPPTRRIHVRIFKSAKAKLNDGYVVSSK